MMNIFHTASTMTAWSERERAGGRKIAFVPTMGALHEGHHSLFRAARKEGDRVVVSLFVNPTQFNDPKDFDRYPRDFEKDEEHCEAEKVDALFAPAVEEIYPKGLKAGALRAGEAARRYEGSARPGHFDGVVTVVARLFEIVRPHAALFGEKDFQQLLVIREMIRDARLPVTIVAHPTVRTPDGLAMSSRNALLTPAGYRTACAIPRALTACRRLFAGGERRGPTLVAALTKELKREAGLKIDYADIADAETLDPVEEIRRPSVALVAAFVEGIRLIDNQRLDPIKDSERPPAP